MSAPTITPNDVRAEPDTPPAVDVANRPRVVSLLFLSAWCGLVAGLLEVGTIVLRKHTFDPNHLYGMSRHFVWLIPAADLCIFLVVGVAGWVVGLAWRRRGPWLFTRALCTLAILPMLLVAFSQIYRLALLAVALGTAARLVPLLERNDRVFGRLVRFSFPILIGIVAVLGGSLWVGDRIKQSIAAARPLPPPGSPNVLLVVLDTVAAGHLSLHGYRRETSWTLVDLAERGIRFDSARAPSSWSLPAHATMFTGRWLHELSAGWLTPLDDTHPTLAEFLGARGYATAGFVANKEYCATDSGLSRGFTRYDDFIFPALTAFRSTALVKRLIGGLIPYVDSLADGLELDQLQLYSQWLWREIDNDRKEAAVVNREFLDWLSRRQQPERPFFAFLNYFDAHHPYQLPTGRMHRFGFEPNNERQRVLLEEWFTECRTGLSPREVAFAVDSYDDCVADLDEQIGILFDELEERGILENTWLIVTSDHGESFGEHPDIFCHGTSLYQTELHVPLVIVPPGGTSARKTVSETVSLRDVAATVVDVIGQAPASPFPGTSLARFWDGKSTAAVPIKNSAPAELILPSIPSSRDISRLPRTSWPQGNLTEGEWSYIRYEGVGHEELFHLRDDAKEQHNLAADPTTGPTLERMRTNLGQIVGGPLLPTRFSP